MKRLTYMMAAVGLMLAAVPALGLDLGSHSINNKRQLAGCMFKRMRDDRAISYLDAKRSCTDDLAGRSASLASSNAPARAERPGTAAAQHGS